MQHLRAGTVIDVLISDVSSQGNEATMCIVTIYLGNIIWQLVRKERDLFLGSAFCGQLNLSAAHGWTLTGTVVGEGLSAGLHRLFYFTVKSLDLLAWTVTANNHACRHGVKNSFQINLGAFQTFCWSKIVVFFLRVEPIHPSMDRYWP